MEPINLNLRLPQPAAKKSGPRSERDEYVDYFHDRLKDGYKAKMRQTLTKKRVAIAIGHLKTIQDLHYLRHICEDAERRGKPFSQVFWGSLKARPEIPNTYPDA
jgi:hypothetical protein